MKIFRKRRGRCNEGVRTLQKKTRKGAARMAGGSRVLDELGKLRAQKENITNVERRLWEKSSIGKRMKI